jgi:hypothetical protein
MGAASRLPIERLINVISQAYFCSHRVLIRCNVEEGRQSRAAIEEAFWLCLVLNMRLTPSVGYIGRKSFVQGCGPWPSTDMFVYDQDRAHLLTPVFMSS